MKLILIACFCLAAFYTNAQFKTLASRFKFENGLIDRGNSYRPGLFAMPSQPQAMVIATNQFGKIYSLPKDKMPCFVPDVSLIATMPNARKFFDNSLMLNPYKNEEVIPQQ